MCFCFLLSFILVCLLFFQFDEAVRKQVIEAQTAFLSSENPYFGLGTWGAMYIRSSLYVTILRLFKCHEKPCVAIAKKTRLSFDFFKPTIRGVEAL